ncbi:MAG: Phospho-2-dehydro-3-deoxyheptonate aldolase [bacterium ADurb.Bin400]|nr:MAG: Phospho-2-dehydro-3-deoxyheptonate aldolase [bacterium ADurb.Bin400]
MRIKYDNHVVDQPFLIIGGPCAIESLDQLSQTAKAISESIDVLRGGAYKPRSKPGSFEGLKLDGLKILKHVSASLNLPTVTEVLDTRDVELVAEYSDILQIGSRNMQNFELLKEAGKTKRPVLLKRGLASTVDEWLSAANYIQNEGNGQIILCERGIRTFETSTRFTLDLAGAIVAKNLSGLPVIVDPSHATGKPELIEPISLAAKAAGLDGIIIETHYKPDLALCDREQAISTNHFNSIVSLLR